MHCRVKKQINSYDKENGTKLTFDISVDHNDFRSYIRCNGIIMFNMVNGIAPILGFEKRDYPPEKAVCLVCRETVSVFKEFNIKRHYETKHEAKFGNLKGELRVTKLEAFKKDIHTQNVSNLFKKQNSTKTNVVQASYKVANLIASETKPVRVENIGNNILTQLQNKARDFKYFSLALDESTDITDTAQLLIIIRGIDINFNITEELASLKSMHYRTTGADIFEKVDLCLQDLKLDWKNLSCITTDGAPNMRGENIGFVDSLYYSSAGSLWKSYRSHGLTHRQFQSFLLEIEAEYNDVVYQNHVRWLSRGKVLKRFFDLRKEIEMFMIDKGKQILELKDDNWLWDLAFLTDVTTHLNILNLKLQGPGKFIFDIDFSHFENCQIFKNNTKSLCSTNRFVCMLNKLQTDISSRFSDVKLHEKSLRLFENPFNIDEIDVDTSFQLELIELKTNSFYYDEFQTMKKNDILKFYSTLSHEDFPALRDIMMKMATVFGSTYICEQIFSRMKQTKSVHRSRLTDEHLHSILRIGTTKFQPDFSLLVKETQVQISH
ncbi:general transcription factor II-I repeat domain-containing protein 2A-like [Rhopalosiphum padi]|uniref:general transcription factor II-I repeat domain-containing protein 2A-like n=1 Tax=Rhopalosiphum padi TaxID=40932 RepID=UPI00298D77C4|nr:general transcription factor II-I repeat domain-containing protein 2A-like [Rhopalosiphum padi]